jgi:hypothetical protein
MWKPITIVACAAAFCWGLPSTSMTGSRPLGPVRGGIVAFLRTPTEIDVAADSAAIEPGEPSTNRPACKILQIGRSNLFIAVAGLNPEAAGGVNQITLINRAHRSSKSILATADAFVQSVKGPLVLELERLKLDSAINYAHDFEGKAVIAIIFCGFERHVPVVCQREFFADTARDGKISIRVGSMDCPGALCQESGTASGLLSETGAARDAGKKEMVSFDTAEPAAAVRRLVQKQIDDQSDDVHSRARGPIDVLRITGLRATWLERKEQCGVIFPYWRNGLGGMER